MENTAISKATKNALFVSYDVLGSHVELDLDFVKRYLVRGRAELVSDQEIVFFMNMCKMQKLNPLASEVYCIKYSKDDPAQVVVGKAAYMRRAFEHPDYIGKEDGITVQRGNEIIQKEGTCLYPGETLIGGWCRVHYNRNGKERTCFKEVALSEYNKGLANWKSKPATMISKVAVSQAVREAFPKDYEGMYSEEEMIASGAIPTTFEATDTNGKVVEVIDDQIITQEERQQFLKAISNSFEGPDKRNEIYYQVLKELGLKASTNMKKSELRKALEIVKRLASEETDVADVIEEPAEEESNEVVLEEENA